MLEDAQESTARRHLESEGRDRIGDLPWCKEAKLGHNNAGVQARINGEQTSSGKDEEPGIIGQLVQAAMGSSIDRCILGCDC